MARCCTKMATGDTCGSTATQRITLTARGLVFKVPICQRCFKQMPAAAASSPLGPLEELVRKHGRQQ